MSDLIELVLYFLYAIAMIPIFFISGFLTSLLFKRLDSLGKITISFFFSTLWILIIVIAYHYAGFSASPFILIPYCLLSLFLFLIVRKELIRFRIDKEIRIIIVLFVIFFLIKITAQIFIKYYPAGADYIGHYKTVLFFLEPEWKLPDSYVNPEIQIYLPYRNPGFYMLLSFFLSIFGSSFWVCQLAATLVNTVFIFPAYCIAKHIFNKKIALLTIIFVSIIPFVETSIYMHSKMAVAYFIFLFFYLFVTKKASPYLLGSIAGLGFMIHQSALVFVIAVAVPYLFEIIKKRSRSEFLSAIKMALAFSIVLLPWLGINYMKYGTLFTSEYDFFPLYTTNYGSGSYTLSELWENFKNTSSLYIVGARVINTVTFVTPIILIFKIVALFFPFTLITGKTNPPLPVNFASGRDLPWAYHYYHTLPGILTMFMFIFVAMGFFKLWKYNKKLFYFVFIPIVLTILWFGWVVLAVLRSGIPEIVPILVMVGFWEICKRKNSKKIIKLIFILAFVELAIFSLFYSWHIASAEQIALERKDNPKYKYNINEYEKLFSAYKLFGLNK